MIVAIDSCIFSQGSLSTHKEATEEEGSPVKHSESLVENKDAAMPGKKTGFVASRHKSLVDLIQKDFPHTPSPVCNQSHSSSHATADELIDFYVQAISSNISSVDKTPEPDSGSINCPEISSPDSHATRLKIKRNQEKPQSHGRNVPKLLLSRLEDAACQVHGVRTQTISQGRSYLESSMDDPSVGHPNLSSIIVQPSLHWHRLRSPFYETAAGYRASSHTPFYPVLRPSSLYAPQYCLPGYALGSTLLPPFMAGYPSHSAQPPAFGATSSQIYTGRTAGISMGKGNLHGLDVPHQIKFYGQHEPIPQPSFVNLW
ncbi:hypothetical protein TIFTF001_031718 [Ficus carica]|uniref:Uncharacterized protein n=1 Tax=Ficus carica TaxID=3494 RepID=A0AA88DVJ9_FICCA|nr:hypothetical protein TIFTF001_031718 [Ficus carica]